MSDTKGSPLIDMIWEATLDLLRQATHDDESFKAWYYAPTLIHLDWVENAWIDELIRRGVVRGWSATEIAQEIISKREKAFAQVQKGGEP